jgi:hypothetical protein
MLRSGDAVSPRAKASENYRVFVKLFQETPPAGEWLLLINRFKAPPVLVSRAVLPLCQFLNSVFL